MNNDLAGRIEFVKTALSEHIGKEEQEQITLIEVLRINRRPFSTVVFLGVRTHSRDRKMVMKVINHHPINREVVESRNQALVEYNILKELHPKFEKVEGCSVPCPILVVPELETYVMEFVDGELLINELRWDRHLSSRKKYARLQEHFHNCGRWLRIFQEFTGIQEVSSDVLAQSIERAESRLRLIEDARHPNCPKSLARIVKALLEDNWRQLSKVKVPVSGRHSDFHPLNILAGENGITVIDFMGYSQDCIAVDGLSMLVHLEDERRSMTASRRRVEGLRERFLEGYGERPEIPMPVLFICEAMQRIVSVWGSISALRGRLHHKWEAEARIKTHIQWLMNEGERKYLWPSC